MERLSCQIINILKRNDVKALFTIPGSLLDLLRDFSEDKEIEIYTASHEEQLGYMAIGYYHSSGRIPAIMVTQGPGVTNLVTPISCAWRDSVPLLIITSFIDNFEFQNFQDSSGRYSSPNVSEILKPITLYQIKFQLDSLKSSLTSLDEILNSKNITKPVFIEIENKLLNEQIELKLKPINSIRKNIQWEKLIRNIEINENSVFLIGCGAKNMNLDSLIGFIQSKGCKIVSSLKATGLVPSNTSGLLGNIGYLGKERANNYLSKYCTLIISVGASLNKLTLSNWHIEFEQRCGVIVNFSDVNYPKAQNIICDLSKINISNSKVQTIDFPIIKNSIFRYIQAHTDNVTYSIESFRKSFFDEYIIRKGDDIITTSSHAPLGCSISLAIGSALYKKEQSHVVLCGDGGLLFTGMNILLLKEYCLPIFVLVIVNHEYKTVASAQRKKWGKSICADLTLPNLNSMRSFFGINSSICKNSNDIYNSFNKFSKNKEPFFAFIDDEII